MINPIWTVLLDQSMYAPINTTFMYGASKLGYIRSVWDNYFSYPAYSFDSLLNPQLAIDMVANKMKNNSNGSWSNFGFLGNGSGDSVTNLGGGNFQFDFSSLNNTTGGNGSGVVMAGSAEANNLQSYTKIMNKLLNKLPENTVNAYKEAMNKSTDAEKLAAVKEIFKTINPEKIREEILNDDEIKKALKEAGYFYGNSNKVKLDDATATEVDSLTLGKSGEVFTTLASNCLTNKNIIEVLSYWNKSHNKDNDRCILRYVANNLTDADYSSGMANFVLALKNTAKEYSDSPAITSKLKEMDDAYDKYLKNAITEYTNASAPRSVSAKNKFKSAILKFAPAFEALYAQVRMQQAAKIDSDINTKYGKEINSTIPNLIEADMIQNATKAYLEKENIEDIPSADNIEEEEDENYIIEEDTDYSSAEERVDTLITKGKIVETDASKSGKYGDVKVYKSKGRNEDGKPQFFIVKDNELVKLKGWLDINKKLHLSDGKTVDFDKITDEHFETLSDSEILTTNKKAEKEAEAKAKIEEIKNETKANIKELVSAGILKNKGNGTYYSEEYKSYYKIDKNGKLYNTTKNREANVGVMLDKAEELKEANKPISQKLAEEDGGVYDLGYETAEDLIGNTDEDEYENVKDALAVLNKDNVVEFLEGYYENDSWGNGLFLQLATEGEKFKNKEVVKVMRAVVDAVPEDLRTTKQYRTMQRVCRMYERKNGDDDFKMPKASLQYGWDRWFGIDDLDQFDDAVEALFQLKEDADDIEDRSSFNKNNEEDS